MLFAATTINYMDRQVLALLKPTLMHSAAQGGIGLTEESFGTVWQSLQLSMRSASSARGASLTK